MGDSIQQDQLQAWTPGPWRQDLEPFHTIIVDGNSHPVATTVQDYQGWESPNPLADSKLIALAPEMAEALLWIVPKYLGFLAAANQEDKAKLCVDVADKLRAIGADNG